MESRYDIKAQQWSIIEEGFGKDRVKILGKFFQLLGHLGAMAQRANFLIEKLLPAPALSGKLYWRSVLPLIKTKSRAGGKNVLSRVFWQKVIERFLTGCGIMYL